VATKVNNEEKETSKKHPPKFEGEKKYSGHVLSVETGLPEKDRERNQDTFQ